MIDSRVNCGDASMSIAVEFQRIEPGAIGKGFAGFAGGPEQ